MAMALKKNRSREGTLPSGATYRVTQTVDGRKKTVRSSSLKDGGKGVMRSVTRTSSSNDGSATPKAKRTEMIGRSGKTPTGNKYSTEIRRYPSGASGNKYKTVTSVKTKKGKEHFRAR